MHSPDDNLGQFVEAINFAVLRVDLSGVVTFANRAAANIFQQQSGALKGLKLLDAASSVALKLPLLNTGCFSRVLSDCNESQSCYFSPSGNLQLLHWCFYPIYTEDNTLCGHFISLHDMTESLAQEGRFRKAEQQLSSILNTIPGYCYWEDNHAVYQGCNTQFAERLGLSRQDIVGKSHTDLSLQDTGLFLLAAESQESSVEPAQTLNQIVRQKKPDGSESVLLKSRAPLINALGDESGALSLVQDITDSFSKLSQDTSNEMHSVVENEVKTTFLANMSHDLKTPLHSVLGLAEILKKNKHSADQAEAIDGILRAGQSILKMVEDVLSFSRLESGKTALTSESFDLRDLIENVVAALSVEANKKGIQLIISYCDSVPHHVKSDAHALRRIVFNLVNNAIKFTDVGHVILSVELISKDSAQANLQVIVEDTGKGIEKGALDRIFDRFYRGDPSYHGQYKGAGLGLTVAKQLAQDLGGTLKVNSQVNSGSTFWCSLPFELANVEEEKALWHEKYSEVRVLIVDDHDIRAFNTKKQLDSESVTVVNSSNALDEVSAAEAAGNPYQIAIIDDEINVGDMLGLGRSLKQHAGSEELMLLAFIKPSSLKIIEQLKSAGFMRQIVKPVQPSELLSNFTEAWEEWIELFSCVEKSSDPELAKVLLVEDNFFSQKVSRVMLEGLGCQLDVASTGKRAIALSRQYYDLIFMDVGLPDLTGDVVTKRIREMKAGNPDVFICALTAHAGKGERTKCVEAGMDEFITKPARLEDFERIIGLSMEKRRKLSEINVV